MQPASGHGRDPHPWQEPIVIPVPFTSVVGAIQPAVLPELAEGREDGLLDRFLWAYPEPRRSRLTNHEISDEATAGYTNLYDRLAGLAMREGENGEPLPSVVSLSLDAWEVFKELSDELQDEMHAPGFPTRLDGVWSKLEAYLARLSLILALCRVVVKAHEVRVETTDVVAAWVLLGYFKAQARRVHVGPRHESPEDLLAVELAGLLQDCGGEWRGEPSDLHQQLAERESEALPRRPDELSKLVLAISARGTWLKAESGWKKNEEGKSRRAIHLYFKNGVDGVVRVDQPTE
jgi:hypothetical protein